ncbi:ABC transporter substrate-binding protein [Terracidiphilus sp.]|uniref:ABC transporter substrate-binding protein n=1 Tax=Terracidiphilus sp. TaxID=1964191 RepID=UPI003C1B0E7A
MSSHPRRKYKGAPRVGRPLLFVCVIALALAGCKTAQRDPRTVVFLIESSPTSLDPRVGTDAQSEYIDELIFDGLVQRDANFHFTPGLAEQWDQPDPKTVIFHLRAGVRFHDGRALTSRDVMWTLNSMRNGTLITAKAASYASIDTMEAPDDRTVVLHLKQPDNFLLTNLSTGAMGIVPEGSGKDFWRHPVGTGPFRFESQQIDQDVVIQRNPQSWSVAPKIERVRFAVVPDSITMSLELEKGSADVESNAVPMDALPVLASRANLEVTDAPGTQVQYLAFNLRDPLLKDARVRQAISCAIDRDTLIRTLMGGRARPAKSLLPMTHWAWNNNGPSFNYDPARAEQLLDDAGYRRGKDGVRLHLTMKTSTVEDVRLLSAVFQQQLARVGIALEIRSYEFATFYSDVLHGAFQLYSLRWIGGNEQPDIFTYAFSSSRFPPKGANRGHYANPQVDALLDDAWQSGDQERRRADYAQAQQMLANDLPAINLWYRDAVVVHNKRLTNVQPSPSGRFTFLESAELTQ